ncbi:MAG TPA: DnaJ C-terminal domain-containing protein [Thermoanaerobaculia bacterium]|nr:DnaJ C-terminal domain-containing protein [Thermoanaerobaculia bacterium]
MVSYQDYYGTLGVDKNAGQPDIQRAYRKLARKYHPDINKDPAAETKFKQIGEAYEVLKDPEKRARYDQFGSAWKNAERTGAPPPGWEGVQFDFGGPGAGGFDFGGGPSGFSSFFEMLFGGGGPFGGGGGNFAGGGASGRVQPAARRGSDQESRITITLEELARGGKRQLTLSDPATGRSETIEVTIPKGLRPGRRIRLAGKGARGAFGGPPGDLLLQVQLEPHPHFRVEGDDLVGPVEVSPSTAALGGEARVRTIDGSATIKLPAGSSSGRRIRLRGKGLPRTSGEPGDQYAEVKIVVPQDLNDEQRRLFQELASHESRS